MARKTTAKAAALKVTPGPTVATTSNDPEGLDMILAALARQPARQSTALEQMVRAAAAKLAFDYDGASAGQKASFTRRIKEAAKASGISL